MRTVFEMIPDKQGKIYCRLKDNKVEFNLEYYKRNCIGRCPYFAGLGSGGRFNPVIECQFDNKSKNILEVIDNPDKLMNKKLRKSILAINRPLNNIVDTMIGGKQ